MPLNLPHFKSFAFKMGDAIKQFGFSVDHTNPFLVFPILQELAAKHAVHRIDLSRGDPGFGFAPSTHGREFYGYLCFLDAKLNNQNRLFRNESPEYESALLEEIAGFTRSHFVPALAERHLKDLSDFIQRVQVMAKGQGLHFSVFDVLGMLFNSSSITGGTYHKPQGELLVRVIVAWWHRKVIGIPIDYDDLFFTNGASHAIGTLFKLLGQEGIQYLNPGDKVLISSPVYSPYNTIMENRGIDVVNVSIDPVIGKISAESVKMLKKIKGVKAVLIIDPNNPTGFSFDEQAMRVLAEFAEKQNALVITDEVYSAFFEERRSLVDWCPKRTIRIQSRSKVERSAGLRFGDVLINKQANEYLTESLLKKLLPKGMDFKKAFLFAKGPGGIQGEFQHTTFVPGPAQFLGAAHIMFGDQERQDFRDLLTQNQAVFCKTLGLPHMGNRYYIIFDLNSIVGSKKKEMPPEEKITELAKRGVVLLPANMFFSAEDRDKTDTRHMVRASLANGKPEDIEKAARIIKDFLCQ